MSDICAKNLGHGHAFNRPFGNTYKCQWCGVLQSEIAEVESLRQRIAKQDGLIATKNADISSWVERDFTNQQTIASLKEKYEIALNRIANFEDMRDEYKQQLASLKEEQRKDSEDMLRLIADIRYVAGIAERGRGKPLGDGEKFTQAVLDYVKSLESQQRDLTQQLAALKEQHNSLLDVYRQNMQLVSELQEQNALLTVQVQRLETAIAPLAGCHLPPDGCEHLGVTANFATEQIVAAKAALIPQDGRTALEKFGMKVATETRSAVLINTREDLFTEDSSLRAIVTNLIGADLPEADKEKS